MIGNINLVESTNSFLKPVGLSLSNWQQIATKITTLALIAIPIASNLLAVSADYSTTDSANYSTQIGNCIDACPSTNLTTGILKQLGTYSTMPKDLSCIRNCTLLISP